MTSLDTDNDDFLRLLTDALRAGPGSPEWHQAVARLRTDGRGEGDEYALLLEARQNLESGKGYRAVRAGPGFTAKVLRGVEEAGPAPFRGPSAGNLVIGLSVVLIVGVIAALGYVLLRGGDPAQTSASELAARVFTRTVVETQFGGGALPPQWRPIGKLALETKDGLALARGQGEKDVYLGGGVVTADAFAPAEAWAVDVELRPAPTPDGVVQLFVSESGDFSADRKTSARELQVVIRDGNISVITPDGREVAQQRPGRTDPRLRDARLRITIDRDAAVIKLADQPLWTGPHGLSADRSRTFGVRLLRKGTNAGDTAVVKSIQLLRP